MIQTEPYSALAEIYDCVMRDVPYRQWVRYIVKLIKKFHPKAKLILELACGTGTMLMLLRKYGFIVDGLDISPRMIEKAREKARDENVKFYIADMSNFEVDGKYDVQLCLYDSVNYLLDIEKFNGLFKGAWNSLNDGGVFVFDISTEYNSVQNAILMNLEERRLGFKYTRLSYYLKDERLHINEFKIETNDGSFFEKHVQRIYKISEIKDVIKNVGLFETVGCFDGFSFSKGSEWSQRVHFVLKKTGKRNG